MVSVRNEQATAATRRGWYRADPRAYIRIAAVLRERITAGELVPGQATPSITRLCADHGVARQTAAHALHVLQMPGSCTGSPDSATTSAMTSFPSFAHRATSFGTVSQAARKRCLPGLRYARYYLRGWLPPGMHNLAIAQTNFPSLSSREYQPHCSLTASTSISPRPCSASSLASVRTGGRGLASHTRIRICAESDSSHSRTAETRPASREALTAFVISSVTRSSALSPRFPIPHSHSTCLACSRAQGTALTRAPSSRKS